MRELVFTLAYEPGCNAVADALDDHPDTRVRSLSLHATERALWRVDHARGSTEGLDAVEEALFTADYYADCLATEDCEATQTTRVLEHTDDTLICYSHWQRTPACASVPHVALDHLGEGMLFETRHQRREYTWRIVHPGTGEVRAFFEDLGAAVGECAVMEVQRRTDTSSPTTETNSEDVGLSPEQEATLRAAVDHGYYETPREIDLGGLAAELDVPRSTLAYRLRRAESHLANRQVDRTRFPEDSSTSP